MIKVTRASEVSAAAAPPPFLSAMLLFDECPNAAKEEGAKVGTRYAMWIPDKKTMNDYFNSTVVLMSIDRFLIRPCAEND